MARNRPARSLAMLLLLASPAPGQDLLAAAASALRKPMELMSDSDGGGCQDGEEDLNADGERTRTEEDEAWSPIAGWLGPWGSSVRS
jgi:hypothetical protein